MKVVTLHRQAWVEQTDVMIQRKVGEWAHPSASGCSICSNESLTGCFKQALRVVWWWGRPESEIHDPEIKVCCATGRGRVGGNGGSRRVQFPCWTDEHAIRFSVLPFLHLSSLLALITVRRQKAIKGVTPTEQSRLGQTTDLRGVNDYLNLWAWRLCFLCSQPQPGKRSPHSFQLSRRACRLPC